MYEMFFFKKCALFFQILKLFTSREVFYSPQWFELFEQNMCDRQLDECTEMFALWPCCFHRQYTGGKKYTQK